MNLMSAFHHFRKKRAARRLIKREFGGKYQLRTLQKGEHNSVFLYKGTAGKLVIRIAYLKDLKQVPGYKHADRAVSAALKAGVPTPEVLLSGRDKPFIYQVCRFLEGLAASSYQGGKLKVWEQIGQIASRINQVTTFGLEDDLYGTHAPGQTWQDYIVPKIKEILDFYKAFRHPKNRSHRLFFTHDQLATIERRLEILKTYKEDRRCLVHLDLTLQNILLDKSGNICGIVDWDHVESFFPAYQVAAVTFWLSPEEIKAFKKGYGVNYDPELVKALAIYEYLTQIPYLPLQTAKVAKDIMLWLCTPQMAPAPSVATASSKLFAEN